MRSTKLIRTAKIGCVILSLLLCAVGVILLLKPQYLEDGIGVMLGCLLIAFGVVKLIGYFSRDLYRLAFQFDLAFGILLLVLGIAILLRPGLAMSTLCVLLGLEIIADSAFKAYTAIDARRFGLEQWWFIMLLAVLAGVAGAVMLLWPATAAQTIAVLLGAALLADGLMNIGVMLCTVKIINHQRPDEAEFQIHF